MSLTHDFWMLLVCVTLVGIGNNIWHPAAIPTLAYRYPDRKGLVLSFHGMGGNLGEAIAPFVIGALLTWLSWRAVVVINVVPGLVMSALILVMLGAFSMTKSKDGSAINDDGQTRNLVELRAQRRRPAQEQNADAGLVQFGLAYRDPGGADDVSCRCFC